jgi:hypothetical protein
MNFIKAHEIIDRWYPGKPLTREEQLQSQVDSLWRELEAYKRRAAEDSWRTNPDRMGGSFSQYEIDQARYGFSRG